MDEKFMSLQFWTENSPKARGIAERVARIAAPWDDQLPPTAIYGGALTKSRNVSFNADVERFIECLTASKTNHVVLTNQGRKRPETLFGFSVTMIPRITVIALEVEHHYFCRDGALEKFLVTAERLAEAVNPLYGCIHSLSEYLDLTGPVDVHKRVPGAFWGNYYGVDYVNKIGKDALLSFDGHLVKELTNQVVYIQLSEKPLPPYSRKVEKGQSDLRRLLGALAAKPGRGSRHGPTSPLTSG